ncbi:hypothetical protein ACFL51_00090 [Myxococcota bacterium]
MAKRILSHKKARFVAQKIAEKILDGERDLDGEKMRELSKTLADLIGLLGIRVGAPPHEDFFLFLEKTGETGAKCAEHFSRNPGSSYWEQAEAIGKIYWYDIVRPENDQREKPQRRFPGLLLENAVQVADRMHPDNRIEVVDGRGQLIRQEGYSNRVVAEIDEKNARAILRRARKSGGWPLSTVSGKRLLRGVLVRIAERFWGDETRTIGDPVFLFDEDDGLPGIGWSKVARYFGVGSSEQAARDVRAAIEAMGAERFKFWDDAVGNMVLWREERGIKGKRKHRPKRIRLTFTRSLCPLDQTGKPIVPVPDHLPPLQGIGTYHAAQIQLQDLLFILLRQNALQFYRESAVKITRRRWESMADEAGLPRTWCDDIRGKIIEPWKAGQEAMLVEVKPWHFTLNHRYRRNATALYEAGRRSYVGKMGGLKKAQMRENPRRRRKKKKRK